MQDSELQLPHPIASILPGEWITAAILSKQGVWKRIYCVPHIDLGRTKGEMVQNYTVSAWRNEVRKWPLDLIIWPQATLYPRLKWCPSISENGWRKADGLKRWGKIWMEEDYTYKKGGRVEENPLEKEEKIKKRWKRKVVAGGESRGR